MFWCVVPCRVVPQSGAAADCAVTSRRQVRQRVVSRLEVWLQNPKWSRPAQELLVSLCSNLTSHTQHDVDVISQLVKFRIKAKPIINLYLSCMRSVDGNLTVGS